MFGLEDEQVEEENRNEFPWEFTQRLCVSLINSPAQCLLMGSVFSGNPVNEIRFHFFFFYYLTFRGEVILLLIRRPRWLMRN